MTLDLEVARFKRAAEILASFNKGGEVIVRESDGEVFVRRDAAIEAILQAANPDPVKSGDTAGGGSVDSHIRAALAILDDMKEHDERNGFLNEWWKAKFDALNAALSTVTKPNTEAGQ